MLTHVTRYFSEHVLGFPACALGLVPFSSPLSTLPARPIVCSRTKRRVCMEWMFSSAFLCSRSKAAPSGRIWPHSDQEGCIRNLRESPPPSPYPLPSAGQTPTASFRNCCTLTTTARGKYQSPNCFVQTTTIPYESVSRSVAVVDDDVPCPGAEQQKSRSSKTGSGGRELQRI